MVDDRAHPVGAWQWDGTRAGGQAIANASGRPVIVLHEYGDRERKPLYLQLPYGSRGGCVSPGDWVVLTTDGVLNEVEDRLFAAIRAAVLEAAEIVGAPV